MLRGIGASLLVIGVLTALVLALVGGRGTPFRVPVAATEWSLTSRANGSLLALAYTETPLEAPRLEGYSFRLEVRVPARLGYVVLASPTGGAAGPYPASLVRGRVYLLSWRDAEAARVLREEGRLDELIRLLEEKRLAEAELRLEGGSPAPPVYAASIPVPPGRYGYIVVLWLNASTPTRAAMISIANVEGTVSLYAVVAPTANQYIRALDVAALGLVVLALDYYTNREEYSQGRLARLLRGARRAAGEARR